MNLCNSCNRVECSWAAQGAAMPECTWHQPISRDELRRLRVSQLRRMVNEADAQRDDLIGYRITEDAPIGSFLWRMARRKWWLAKFSAACLAEIERLRGEG